MINKHLYQFFVYKLVIASKKFTIFDIIIFCIISHKLSKF